ncbi:Alpha N-terminal protein methyltransferase 1 [Tolypocladium ophioglossoides CBS 100239]|uniref:Alpha N-terminal protein methyltransferase 1 n=1 Tax=Tolypocladium ophioglossoides (strain CBS 100239) TaxID=1163406 RepID=A0A0L0N1C4_TOLOC|nr:Alpha N-terminal protein methyltransferase 1 [Tolypocladium ophioglossoides CBS 100239]
MSAPAPDSYISAHAGRAYWQGVDADISGMLVGIPAVSKIDLQGSRAFLAKLGVGRGRAGLRALTRALEGGAGYVFSLALSLSPSPSLPPPLSVFLSVCWMSLCVWLRGSQARPEPGRRRARAVYRSWLASRPAVFAHRHAVHGDIRAHASCVVAFLFRPWATNACTGASIANAPRLSRSIGRVTEGLLLTIADTVDVVEPIAKFTDALSRKEGVRRVYNIGLEDWDVSAGEGTGSGGDGDDEDVRYDLFWNQWCLGHLKDDQLVRYLQRCTARMRDEKSLIVVKENMSTSGRDLYDEVDSSVTRQDEKFRRIFEQAGLRIVRTELQKAMPKELFPVRMYALRPH